MFFKDKQTKRFFKAKNHFLSSTPMEQSHMDLLGPTRTCSQEERDVLVVGDDFSRFTLISFLATEDETLRIFSKLYRQVQNIKRLCERQSLM